ncbi:SsgA family sporulation/cell division regulator [Streptomyces mirabilis]|uniref:SsgA family sporulation/cell division regulator n=1 Tax=Streptomyces mirabilis TaxID=68239 RepID=UPI0033CCD028
MALRYEGTEPYVVRATVVLLGSGKAVEWVLGRDLLIDGLNGPSGEGNVRMWPVPGHDADAVYLSLSCPAGTTLVEVPIRPMLDFLADTEAVVPRGTEFWCLDLDTELTHLLAE